jgi:hypothetical protein
VLLAVGDVPVAEETVEDRRWPVLYIAGLLAAGLLCYQRGFLLVQGTVRRLLLLNEEGWVVDSRGLREGEEISWRSKILFPCHVVHIGYTLECKAGGRGGKPEANARHECEREEDNKSPGPTELDAVDPFGDDVHDGAATGGRIA